MSDPSQPADVSANAALARAFYERSSATCLSQGDILLTKVLDEEISRLGGGRLSAEVYPYFFSRYRLCVVLNATCDLVVGSGRPAKVDCVQLVALSPLKDTLEPLIKRQAGPGHEFGLIDQSAYIKLTDEFRRIVDGQHKNRYFLPPIPEIGLEDSPWTARLDVIVSIRFTHPAAFVGAQTGHKIQSQRASKLAENTASLFHRVALDDVQDVLEEAFGSNAYRDWVLEQTGGFCKATKSSVYAAALPDLKAECKGLTGSARDDKIAEILERHKAETRSPKAQRCLKIIRGVLGSKLKPEAADEIFKSLAMNNDLQNILDS